MVIMVSLVMKINHLSSSTSEHMVYTSVSLSLSLPCSLALNLNSIAEIVNMVNVSKKKENIL